MAYTREEALLNSISSGQPSGVKPITREEQYLAYIAGESNSRPVSPITRKEHFLERIATSGTGGGSSINVQPLSVTENGTYTAPSGMAYSPVNVNVASQGGGGDSGAEIVDAFLQGKRVGKNFANERVTSLFDYVFYKTQYEDVTFPNVTKIGERVFQMSGFLTKADFGKVETISQYAFVGCQYLKTLIIRTDVVCTLSHTNAFNSTPIQNGTGFIFVRDNLVEKFKIATNWATYASQIKGISELNGGGGGGSDSSKVTFTVASVGGTYTVDSGTTWEHWLYETEDGVDSTLYTDFGGYVIDPAGYLIVDGNGDFVMASNEIKADTYTSSEYDAPPSELDD